jgi:hypothetical protein
VTGGGASTWDALLAGLRDHTRDVPVQRIQRVWLFPPRPVGSAESSLAVLSLTDLDDPAARRVVLTLHCTATVVRGRLQRTDRLVEQGSVPAERVDGVIRGVLQRLRDDTEVPRSEEILGLAERWEALLQGAGVSA